MGAFTDYLESQIGNVVLRTQAAWKPAAVYVALYVANKGYSSAVRSQAVALGDVVIPTTPNGHAYKCTTAGTCGAGEPSWNTGEGSTTSDGGAVWTEMTPDFEGNTSGLTNRETSGGSYARVQVPQADAQWNAPSGGNGLFSNVNAITFPAPTANWGLVFGWTINDAATVGNALIWGMLTTPKTVNNNDAAPSFAGGAPGAMQITLN